MSLDMQLGHIIFLWEGFTPTFVYNCWERREEEGDIKLKWGSKGNLKSETDKKNKERSTTGENAEVSITCKIEKPYVKD